MPKEVDVNHMKQDHQVANPKSPLKTSCVNTDLRFWSESWKLSATCKMFASSLTSETSDSKTSCTMAATFSGSAAHSSRHSVTAAEALDKCIVGIHEKPPRVLYMHAKNMHMMIGAAYCKVTTQR